MREETQVKFMKALGGTLALVGALIGIKAGGVAAGIITTVLCIFGTFIYAWYKWRH